MKALTLLQDYYHDIIYFIDKNNIDEAIAELEALQQPKSCEGCKWNDIPFPSNQFHCDECKHAYSYYNDNFEPK